MSNKNQCECCGKKATNEKTYKGSKIYACDECYEDISWLGIEEIIDNL
jgi:ribosome-binding protein aMBF1 (putative translation factor)